ncbi:MAG: hypothetical protein ABIJ34_00310 [archaeon]
MGFFNNFSGKPGDIALPANMPPPPIPKRLRSRAIIAGAVPTMSRPIMPSAQPRQIKFETPAFNPIISIPAHKEETPKVSQERSWMINESPSDIDIPERLPDLSIPMPRTNFGFEEEIPAFDISIFNETIQRDILPPTVTTELLSLKDQGPLFVRTDDYSQIISNLETMSGYIQESPGVIYVLNNIKRNMDMEHKNFAKVLEDMQRKFIYIDNLLFESMKEVEL